MKVYELIQELVQYDASAKVEIRVLADSFDAECTKCGENTPIGKSLVVCGYFMADRKNDVIALCGEEDG